MNPSTLLRRWANLKRLRSPQEREAEFRALQSFPLFCSHNGHLYRLVGVEENGRILLAQVDEHGQQIQTEISPEECSEWVIQR